MRMINLRCKIITPLFMGGANQQAELRTQSFNGLFRYWFRLLGGSFDDEKRLFGWGGEGARKGIVQIFCKSEGLCKRLFAKAFDSNGRVIPNRGINYLGFSPDTRFNINQNRPRREYLLGSFELTIMFNPTANEEDIKKFLSSVWCAFYLGNFGSRSRRGFGSIVVEEIDGDVPSDLNFKPNGNICDWLRGQLNKIKNLNYWNPRKDIPWVFGNMEVYKVEKGSIRQLQSWIKDVQNGRRGRYLVNRWALSSIGNINYLHDFMGFLLLAYRSYYQPDYRIARGIIQNPGNAQQNQVIERSIFGLPLNFYFSSLRRGGAVEASLNKEKLRRASPLVFKIISDGANNFEGFIIVFKPNENHNFVFLPNRARISLQNVDLQHPNWNAIDGFINSLQRYGLITKCYP